MTTLAQKLQGRDNNLGLIRILGAWTIFFSHCFTLVTGSEQSEPLVRLLGMNVGTFALDFFFLASGLLVTKSLVDKEDLRAFARARALRVYPALVLIVVATALALGAAATTLSLSEYFTHRSTRGYVVWNIVLVRGVQMFLPGVFDELPWAGAVNASLWSMTYEVRAYLLLALFWVVGSRFGRRRRSFLATSSVAIAAACLVWHVRGFSGPWDPIPRVSFMFAFGSSAYFLRDRIPLGHGLAAIAAAILFAGALLGPDWFRWAHLLGVPYLLLYLAFVPAGVLRLYNKVGDYSYGTYLYAFPVQQAWIHFMPHPAIWQVMAGAGTIVLILSVLSWHLLESPAMRFSRPAPGEKKPSVPTALPSGPRNGSDR